MLSAIYGLIKAIPSLERLFQALFAMYLKAELESRDKEFTLAMRTLISDHDQRALEKAIGSVSAGKPTPERRDVVDVAASEFQR